MTPIGKVFPVSVYAGNIADTVGVINKTPRKNFNTHNRTAIIITNIIT